MTTVLREFDGHVAIVGSGLAGLMTALTLAPRPVVIVTRGRIGSETSSAWAQGGIAAALGDDDSIDIHLADTLSAGDGLCDATAAAGIIAEGPAAVSALERFGVRFDLDGQGRLSLGLEAAHSRRRIVHSAGDGSGAALVFALASAVARTPSIKVLEGTEARMVLKRGSEIAGLLVLTPSGAAVIATSHVVLATGGIGGLYDATTNPLSNFGHGIALAAKAGATLADMEFVQFHPTGLASTRRPLALVSEAVRGEGATLVNDRGERFMADIEGGELAPRDIVARAISLQISQGRRVFLDARLALGDLFGSRFPTIHRLCGQARIDPARDLIPVRPAAHYHMGGVATNQNGRSSVDGLWVVGEAASTGLHGANRLASNSLLEAAVMGMRAGKDIGGTAPGAARIEAIGTVGRLHQADTIDVGSIVSRHLGVLRHGAGLEGAIAALLPLATAEGPRSDPATVALLIAVCALIRTESRGAHARTDFPSKRTRAERRTITLSTALDMARATAHSFARSA
jgi:L-aspartate oxidase